MIPRACLLAQHTARALKRGGVLLLVLGLTVLLLASGLVACLTPPVLMPAIAPNMGRALRFYPPGTSLVGLQTEGGATLRGVFVPAAADAPVVLHLLGAAQSPASIGQPLDLVAWDLADRGFASLLLDYRGVGASSGERDVGALEDDARRMWDEAVRRAGGKPERVLIRATSLGTIATALAVRSGARPAAVLLVAPVFPDTVVERFARDRWGLLVGWFAAAVYRPVARVDVIAELERSGAPLCVSLFEGDTWATARQRRALEELTRSREPHDWTMLGGDHIGGVAFTIFLRNGEFDFLDALPGITPPAARSVEATRAELSAGALEALAADNEAALHFEELARRFMRVPAEQLAAAALEHEDLSQAVELVRLLRHTAASTRDLELLRALYSIDGAAPAALLDAIFTLVRMGGDMERRGAFYDDTGWDDPVGIAANVRDMSRAAPQFERRLLPWRGTGNMTTTSSLDFLVEATSSDEDFRIVLARAALKAAGIPDRPVEDEDGGRQLECFGENGWTRLDVHPGTSSP